MAIANTQHCFVTTITDEKLPGYRHHHDNIWPEVAAGLRAAGIASLKIYSMPSGKPGINTLGENPPFITSLMKSILFRYRLVPPT